MNMRARVLFLAKLTRTLNNLPKLKGNVFVIGGILNKGYSFRDIDIMVNKEEDIPTLKKALSPFVERLNFLVGKFPKGRIFLYIRPYLKNDFKKRKNMVYSHKDILKFIKKKIK